jgi:predicted  nucleic acid-binding Zn-ribbon protein
MLPDVEVAVRLQAIDLRISDLQKEIAALPKHVAEIENKLSIHERRLERDRAALAANQKERKRLDGEIQIFEAKITKLRDQMLGAKNNEQYRAFQNEIDFAAKEIRGCEDKILDLMTESESLDKSVKSAEAALKEERQIVDADKARAEKRTAEDRKRVAELLAQRRNDAASMSPSSLATYERIRKARGGIAVSEAVDSRCTQCRITLRPQFMQELKRGEAIRTCETCGRILYWNAPKNPEDLGGVNALSDASARS